MLTRSQRPALSTASFCYIEDFAILARCSMRYWLSGGLFKPITPLRSNIACGFK